MNTRDLISPLLWTLILAAPVSAAETRIAFTEVQQKTLLRYAEACLRYFTSGQSNNLTAGLTHSFFGTGKRRDAASKREYDMNRERGSHVNMEEVTVRFLALAVGYKEGWLNYLPADQRYAGSWGQIRQGLSTLRMIQTNTQPWHYTEGTFHRWYWTTYSGEHDVPPAGIRSDTEMNQASDDNGLAFMNLLLLEGLAADPDASIRDRSAIIELSRAVRSAINLRRFYYPRAWIEQSGNPAPVQADVIVHQIVDGQPSLKYKTPTETTGADQGVWDRSGAEGAVILAATLLSGGITLDQFSNVARQSLLRKDIDCSAFGATIPIQQTTYDAAMFMAGVRSLHGMPVTLEESAGASFYLRSTLPIFRSHLAFAERYNLSALGSHAMSQTIGGLRPYYYLPAAGSAKHGLCQFPGNEENSMPDPWREYGPGTMARSTAPHAFFVPLSRPQHLNQAEREWIFGALQKYEPDFFSRGLRHPARLGSGHSVDAKRCLEPVKLGRLDRPAQLLR